MNLPRDQSFRFVDSVYSHFPSPGVLDRLRHLDYRGQYYFYQAHDLGNAMRYLDSGLLLLSGEEEQRRKAAIAASSELQERDALKSVGLAASMTTALVARGVPDPTAHLAAELGLLAFKRGYADWTEADRESDRRRMP